MTHPVAILVRRGLLLVFVLSVATPSPAWQTDLASRGSPPYDQFRIAVDPAADVVAGGLILTSEAPAIAHFGVVKLSHADGTELWRTTLPGQVVEADDVRDMVVDASGDIVAVGGIGDLPLPFGSFTDFLVVKLSGADGSVLWETELNGTAMNFDEARAVDLDGSGDVFVAGVLTNTGTNIHFAVVKLSGIDGTELWRRVFNQADHMPDWAHDVAVDSTGDVIAAGYINNGTATGTRADFAVFKLAGTDGTVLWQRTIDQANRADGANAVVTDSGDNVVAVGYLNFSMDNKKFMVVKLSGADGSELWRQEVANTGITNFVEARSVSVDSLDNVIAAGITTNDVTGPDFTVMKFAAADGAELWRVVIDGGVEDPLATLMIPVDEAFRVVTDSADDVVAVGSIEPVRPTNVINTAMLAVKLSGSDGSQVWRRTIRGNPLRRSWDVATDVVVNDDGDVTIAGSTNMDSDREKLNPEWLRAFTVAKLDGNDGGHTVPVSGKKIVFRSNDNAEARKLTVKSRDTRHITVPLPGTAEDPTIGGATLEIRNGTTGEVDTYTLPASNWTTIGRPPKTHRGYRYKDQDLVDGPCNKARLREGRLAVRCRGNQISFTLNEPAQGSLGVTFGTGPDLARRCMLFGGIRHDDGSKGLFKAANAPASPTCPTPLP